MLWRDREDCEFPMSMVRRTGNRSRNDDLSWSPRRVCNTRCRDKFEQATRTFDLAIEESLTKLDGPEAG